MKKSEIKNSADLFFYKGRVDFNVAVLLLESFSEPWEALRAEP